MIDYIKYTIDGKTYDLVDMGDGNWDKLIDAPSVTGRYDLLLEIRQNSIVTYIDSNDPRYNFYLDVIISAERVIFLEELVPKFLRRTPEFKALFGVENIQLDKLYASIERVKSDMFIMTASNDAVERLESFIRVKGRGTLEQRKSFLVSLNRKGNKLSEVSIKNITNSITGSNCIVSFSAQDGVLQVQVLSPDNQKDYRYEDILRTLKPLSPAHIKLLVVKYFATWDDIKSNFASWTTVKSMADWEAVKSYIPPQ